MNTKIAVSLLTIAEQSAYRQTGRTDEVERLSAAFAATWPSDVSNFEYGRSAEGRPLRALFVSRSGARSPQDLKRLNVPLLMLQGGIHPGESDGKDAGFIALREMLTGAVAAEALKSIAILFVPAFNTDGHERFGRWNRPNQDGPEEMGWRATAQNLNLNRDYMKAEAPEMQAMLRLLNEWDPLVCADLHVTDGANFEPDISLQVEPVNQGEPTLHAAGEQLRDELIEKLAAQGSLPLPFYPDLVEMDNPASGFHLSVYSPRFSSGYFAYRNRFTVLVETHSWKNYATRVRVTKNTIVGLVELVAAHGREWLELTTRADDAGKRLAGSEVALDFAGGWREPTKRLDDAEESTASSAQQGSAARQNQQPKAGSAEQPGAHANITRMPPKGTSIIEFRGYAYTRAPSKISGEPVTVYDPSKPEIWRVPFHRDAAPSLIVKAPRGGYLIPVAHAELVGKKLALHGVAFKTLDASLGSVNVTAFRATRTDFSGTPFEGCMTLKLGGAWREEAQEILAGSLFVPVNQTLARLAMALLEPQAPDSLASWGFFNGCFEHKEYIEPYVAEIFANEMLNADPKLAAEFQSKLTSDPAFATDAAARREFFHQRHPSWDERFNLYPVYRSDSSY